MNWIILLLVLVVLFLIFKNFKHHMFMKMLKVFAVLIVFVLILLVVSHYVDIGDFFNKDNTLSKTGAAIVETVKDNFEANGIVKEADLNDMLDTGISKVEEGLETAKSGINN